MTWPDYYNNNNNNKTSITIPTHIFLDDDNDYLFSTCSIFIHICTYIQNTETIVVTAIVIAIVIIMSMIMIMVIIIIIIIINVTN